MQKILPGVVILLLLSACTPRVEVAVPDKPITINLNVKIEHEVRVKVEKDLENLFDEEDSIF
ncbi:YnbE family lipoprotein [Hahella sp. CCB-MM4]|uniref:YnbE family lipoprotein n=1 Tax=Hahella sp. (strain CCB-MM4) TaxID=1926491 RepID=UPI000B9AF9DC|nr:YnbE family lipoprotein [Hahella sp. CCB-MM4]OZG70790.1 YnbE family lipoprotein [Hahella sp. CCB-MM4]